MFHDFTKNRFSLRISASKLYQQDPRKSSHEALKSRWR